MGDKSTYDDAAGEHPEVAMQAILQDLDEAEPRGY